MNRFASVLSKRRYLLTGVRTLAQHSTLAPKMKTYLIWFVHEHVEFRHAELQSLIELLGAKIEFPERKLDGRRLWMVDTRSVDWVFVGKISRVHSAGDSAGDRKWASMH